MRSIKMLKAIVLPRDNKSILYLHFRLVHFQVIYGKGLIITSYLQHDTLVIGNDVHLIITFSKQ